MSRADDFERAGEEARRRWGRITPYRLGLVLGEWGKARAPLPGRSRKWRDWYRDGLKWGAVVRSRLAERGEQ